MKNKNLFPIILLVIIIIIAIVAIMTTSIEKTSNSTDLNEFTPEEEISNEQLREALLTLYYVNISDNTLKSEGRLIDSTQLLENPYKLIVQYLIDGPKNDALKTVFPNNTKILNAVYSKGCVTLNFSEELLNYEDENQKFNIINCILNSLTQLTEVNSIKIQINGKTNEKMSEEYSKIH